MTQEEKELLLKDLSARLPYRVKVRGNFSYHNGDEIVDDIKECTLTTSVLDWVMNGIEVKPYLRPMSSMTDEERNELQKVLGKEGFYLDGDGDIMFEADCYPDIIFLSMCDRYVNWLYEHHFDFHRLIFKGLALEAPEGMYDVK